MHETGKRLAQALCIGALAGLTLCASGCLVGFTREVSTKGPDVAASQLKAVEEGVTTREQIIQAFGEPTQTLQFEGGREELIYVQKRSVETKAWLFFIFAMGSEDEQVTRYHFALQDGVLVNHWRD